MTKTYATRILPTDKHGNVYYGPKTVAQALAAIREMEAEPSKVVSDLLKAGYTRIAAIVAKTYGITLQAD